MRLLSNIFYLADLAAGRPGLRCPSCAIPAPAQPIYRKLVGLGGIYDCPGCALLYRPTALLGSRAATWYYTHAYIPYNIEARAADAEHALEQARELGRDRSALTLELLSALPTDRRSVCVLGCSWGYEVEFLRRAGIDAFGIEIGRGIREAGRRAFGIEVHESIDAAARARRGGIGLLTTSHVIEHIPKLDAALRDMTAALRPLVQLHITPSVERERDQAAVRHAIGREHPIGVTVEFWRRRGVTARSTGEETIAEIRHAAAPAVATPRPETVA